MALQITAPLPQLNVPHARFNIGGHLFQISIDLLSSERGRATKLWKAFEFNSDACGKQVDSELNFDRDYCAFPLILDFLCGKELQLSSFGQSQLHLLRDEAAFFGISSLVQNIDSHIALALKPAVKTASAEPHKSAASLPHDDQDSDSSLSAQGSWHSNSSSASPSPAAPSSVSRKRKVSEPLRAHKRIFKTLFASPRAANASLSPELPTSTSSPAAVDALPEPAESAAHFAASNTTDAQVKKCGMCNVSQSSGRRPMLWRRGPNGAKT